MSRILVVDGSPVCRELLAKVLETEGFSVSCAPTSADGLRVLGAVKPALVLLDPATAGEGIRFLEVLRRRPEFRDLRVAMLTDISDKTFVMRAGALGVRDYILKRRFSLAELLTRIQRYVRAPGKPGAEVREPMVREAEASGHAPAAPAPSGQRTPAAAVRAPEPTPVPPQAPVPAGAALRLCREQTLARLEDCLTTRTLPGVVSEVIALVNSPRGAISDVADVLKRDPVLAARVLHLANSAAFASQKPRIATIDEAVRNIGTGGVRGMMLSAGIFESLPMGEHDKLQMLRCWQHSFAVASVMDRLVPAGDATPAGVAHLTGLCHDLGEIVLRQQFPQEYMAATELASRNGKGFPFAISEVLGLPYQDFMSLLLTKMGLPPVITVPIEEFFDRAVRRSAGGIGSVLARALRMANVYAHGLMLAPTSDEPVTPISNAEYRNAFGGAAVPELDSVLLRSEALTTVNLLAGVAGAQASEVCRPMVTASDNRIAYQRHASYSTFDPVGVLLGFAGEVDVMQSPPEAEKLREYDALVIAASRQENPLVARQEIEQALKAAGDRPIPVLYLGGVGPENLSVADHVLCRKLPISLADATCFLNSIGKQAPASEPAAAAA